MKNAALTIQSLEENYLSLTDNIIDAVIVVRRDGTVIYVNSAAEGLLYSTKDALINKLFEYPLDVGHVKEIEIIRADRPISTVEMSVAEINWKQAPAYLITLHDVTIRKRALEELERNRQEQLHMKDQFLSNVSHELRSPLTAIYMFVNIMLNEYVGDLSSEQREYLQIILKNTEQLKFMIDDLLDATRARIGKLSIELQDTFINEIINESIISLRTTAKLKNIAVSTDLSHNLPNTYADPKRVRQILINIVDNAIKFTPQNGTIIIQTQISNDNPNFIMVSVTDSGVGINPEEIERIFDQLYQVTINADVTSKGLGLGLYICKELVHHQGGHIWAESQPGKGSTFHFTLPVFSISNIIAPILKFDSLQENNLAVVVLEIYMSDKRPVTKLDEILLKEVRLALNHCIIPKQDIVLPMINESKRGALFFLVTISKNKDLEILINRLKEQLKKIKNFNEAEVKSDITINLVNLQSIKLNTNYINEIAEQITQLIYSATKEECDVKKENSCSG